MESKEGKREKTKSMYHDYYKKFYEDISLLKKSFPVDFDNNIIIYFLISIEDRLVGLNNNLSLILEELVPKEKEEEEEK